MQLCGKQPFLKEEDNLSLSYLALSNLSSVNLSRIKTVATSKENKELTYLLICVVSLLSAQDTCKKLLLFLKDAVLLFWFQMLVSEKEGSFAVA